MKTSSVSTTEDLRLLALYREELLDTEAEAAFDALTRAAALVCETPISLVSLVDGDRQWFKSAFGLPQGSETPRDQAFCSHAIETPAEIFEVSNALEDSRFVDNPLVTGDPNIRFYAGMPVRSVSGDALGTLCVIDRIPRVLTEHQRAALQEIARGVEALIVSRHQNHENARRLSRVYVETPGLLYLLDSNGSIIEVSDYWLDHFGYKRSSVLGRNAREFMSDSARREFLKVRDQLWRAGGCTDFPCQFVTASGQPVDVLMSAAIERDNDGQPLRVKCVLTDVTRQLRMQRALEEKGRLDEMTGIPNRSWFRQRLQIEMDRAQRYQRPLALVMFDIDEFKKLNDTYGHAAGDRALVVLANQARLALRGSDEIGRIGGDEFAILLTETTVDQAAYVAQRLRSKVQMLDRTAHALASNFMISLGVTAFDASLSIDAVFARVDAAFYAAKRGGRNRVAIWEEIVRDGQHHAGVPNQAARDHGIANRAVALEIPDLVI